MGNRPAFSVGEWYHCYSRGVDRREVFETLRDYDRFVELLYLANSTESIERDSNTIAHEKAFEKKNKVALVSIGAYALMPNHFHLLIFEKQAGGISAFMRKMGIAYTMYFNAKRQRIGNLFVKPFRSRHIVDDRYFQHCVDYIHLNPSAVLDRPDLQETPKNPSSSASTDTAEMSSLQMGIQNYKYSSLMDFLGVKRPENSIIGEEVFGAYEQKSVEQMLANANEYSPDPSFLQR